MVEREPHSLALIRFSGVRPEQMPWISSHAMSYIVARISGGSRRKKREVLSCGAASERPSVGCGIGSFGGFCDCWFTVSGAMMVGWVYTK
jgi:hypothetical protein